MKYLKLILVSLIVLVLSVPVYAGDANLSTQTYLIFNNGLPTTNTTYTQGSTPDNPYIDMRNGLKIAACFSVTGTYVTSSVEYQLSGDGVNWTDTTLFYSITDPGYYCTGAIAGTTITDTGVPYIQFLWATGVSTSSDLHVVGRTFKK